jgi:hypothetical protein
MWAARRGLGPICGVMLVDYLLSGGKWTGPRAGFNPAGWIAWAVEFVVGILPNLKVWFNLNRPDVPAAPVLAISPRSRTVRPGAPSVAGARADSYPP